MHIRWKTWIALTGVASALAACFVRPTTIGATNTSGDASAAPVPSSTGSQYNGLVPSATPTSLQETSVPSPTVNGSKDVQPLVTIYNSNVASASIVDLNQETKESLPAATLAAVEVKGLADGATSSVTLILAAVADLTLLQVARERTTEEGVSYLESAKVQIVDKSKGVIAFVSKGNGVYVILPSTAEPADKPDFPYYEGISGDQQTYQYDPAQDRFVSGSSAIHGPVRPYYSVLVDADIASASVLFSPGDGHDKEPGSWHALKFYRYAYHYAKLEDRAWVWKRMAPLVAVYDTRKGIDASAEVATPYANMRIGFSYGALRNRAGKAIANNITQNEPLESRRYYLHHFGDISWAGEHLGIKIADPKAWRASTQGRPYATHLALAHGAFFHNLSTPLALRPLKNMEDPIRDLGVSWQAYGHRSFFPPARRYPDQYAFITFFQFGRLGGIPLPEILSGDDAYSIPCSEASEHFRYAAEETGKYFNGECRYNFLQALERLEKNGAPREIRYAGFFPSIPELVRANREVVGLAATNIAEAMQWKDRNAATIRRALAWMQSEQALSPHGLPCGDGIADCASAFGYEGSEPLVNRNGSQLELNYGALEHAKIAGIKYRPMKGATHADFAGKGTDDPHSFSEAERAIYDLTLADLRAYDQAALPNGTHTLSGSDVRVGMGVYLGKQEGNGWSYSSEPYRTGPNRYEFTFWVQVRVPEVGHYVDERDDYYVAKFRWHNGYWWFDGEEPQYQYSRSVR
ncbi:hypothetical protein HY622_01670 [Candidatus Uhrbacteria bacterium]|nr:hypothetical protein [Candidatus Uhrbacteria bacterium]